MKKTAPVVLLGLALLPAPGAAQRLAPSHAVAAAGVPPVHEVARVNGTILRSDRLDAAVARMIPAESFHRNVSPDKLADIRIRALDTLIDEELQYQDALRRQLRVSEREVDAAWTEAAARYGGSRGFEAALRQSGATPAAARTEIRRSLLIARVAEKTVASCSVSRGEAEQYVVSHPERFRVPEELHIHAVTVGVDPSSPSSAWPAARTRAAEAHAALERGVPFEEVASTYSTDQSREKGGDMGWVHRGSLTPLFEDAARDLQVGRSSGVIESLYGYHVIRLTEIRPAHQAAVADVVPGVQKDLSAERCDERRKTWIAGLRAGAQLVVPTP